MLQAHDLGKSYGTRAVVDGLSLELVPGQVLGLLGPNGAGKSTTVSMLCGLVPPDRGRLSLDGAPVNTRNEADTRRLKARIGLVPQDLALFEDLPAQDNLALFGAMYGLDRRTLATRVQGALALVGLEERARDKPATFSGGMKRRLNIACALVHDPDILLFDEPTVGVDPQSRNAIFDSLEALKRRGKALLYTTHYMEEAERLCDRIAIVDHGRLLADDTLDGLLRRLPASTRVRIGLDAPADIAMLQRLDGVVLVEPVPDGVTVALDHLDRVGAVLEALLAQGRHVQHLDSARASLEDVFLSLTGHQLRD